MLDKIYFDNTKLTINIKHTVNIKFYRQVVKFAYKGYKVKEFEDEFGEIKRVDQCDIIRRMTEIEVINNYKNHKLS